MGNLLVTAITVYKNYNNMADYHILSQSAQLPPGTNKNMQKHNTNPHFDLAWPHIPPQLYTRLIRDAL